MTSQYEQYRYRSKHPKINYTTAKDAARAIQETNRSNRQSHNHYEHSRSRLEVYYDVNTGFFHIGHSKH